MGELHIQFSSTEAAADFLGSTPGFEAVPGASALEALYGLAVEREDEYGTTSEQPCPPRPAGALQVDDPYERVGVVRGDDGALVATPELQAILDQRGLDFGDAYGWPPAVTPGEWQKVGLGIWLPTSLSVARRYRKTNIQELIAA